MAASPTAGKTAAVRFEFWVVLRDLNELICNKVSFCALAFWVCQLRTDSKGLGGSRWPVKVIAEGIKGLDTTFHWESM